MIEVIGKDNAFLRSKCAEWETGLLGRDRRWQSNWQFEFNGELKVDVEELRPQGYRSEVRSKVSDVDSPSESAFDLGA